MAPTNTFIAIEETDSVKPNQITFPEPDKRKYTTGGKEGEYTMIRPQINGRTACFFIKNVTTSGIFHAVQGDKNMIFVTLDDSESAVLLKSFLTMLQHITARELVRYDHSVNSNAPGMANKKKLLDKAKLDSYDPEDLVWDDLLGSSSMDPLIRPPVDKDKKPIEGDPTFRLVVRTNDRYRSKFILPDNSEIPWDKLKNVKLTADVVFSFDYIYISGSGGARYPQLFLDKMVIYDIASSGYVIDHDLSSHIDTSRVDQDKLAEMRRMLASSSLGGSAPAPAPETSEVPDSEKPEDTPTAEVTQPWKMPRNRVRS